MASINSVENRFVTHEGDTFEKSEIDKRVEKALELSLKAQRADFYYLHKTFRVEIPETEHLSMDSLPIFPSTTQLLTRYVKPIVDQVLSSTDYDGLKPFCELLKARPLEGYVFKAKHETQGTSCTGVAKLLLDTISAKRQREGAIAVQVDSKGELLPHAGLIYRCGNGVVFVDNSPFKGQRIYCSNGRIDPEAKIVEVLIEGKLCRFDMSLKHPVDQVRRRSMLEAMNQVIAIVAYNESRKTRDIIIKPYENVIRLMKYRTNEKQYITFDEVLQDRDWLKTLKQFMNKDFHLPYKVVAKEIQLFVSNIELLRKLFPRPS